MEGPDFSNWRLAEYSGVPLEKVLSIAGHLPRVTQTVPVEWPEFREYSQRKYKELDEDVISVIEGLIERRRGRLKNSNGTGGPS